MLAKIVGFLTRNGKQLAGTDKAGNAYFRQSQTVDGAVTEKRWIKFKGNPDPTTVPVEWNSWLNGRRERAPTPEEMIELEAHRKAVKVKVALLEKEEEKNRFRAKVLQQGMSNGQNTDVGVEQVKSNEVHKDAKPDFQPETWNPSSGGAESTSDVVGRLSEPKGKGDTFKPGTWQPPS
ncbi:unnamed protein product [Sphagnum jensenii]|uniref:NADH dehydrogenase [ubiquinone] 1 alpha subcomplex subunit 12 n=1 Tax=Sphagnum jensenii TaxID=128206 RepID=A0ABP0WJY2_9BRYO